ncbi:MAG: hypothetical protein WC492_02675 [Candidatus Micrarchaeia archaeon]
MNAQKTSAQSIRASGYISQLPFGCQRKAARALREYCEKKDTPNIWANLEKNSDLKKGKRLRTFDKNIVPPSCLLFNNVVRKWRESEIMKLAMEFARDKKNSLEQIKMLEDLPLSQKNIRKIVKAWDTRKSKDTSNKEKTKVEIVYMKTSPKEVSSDKLGW